MALPANGYGHQHGAAAEGAGGYVEIVEPNDRAFFKAQLLDINPEIRQYFVRYIGEDEPLWVDAARVRTLPPSNLEDQLQFRPKEYDKVEVSFSEEDQVESWWEGEVVQCKGEFYLVTFSDPADTSSREIVERERLRPAYGLRPATFEKLVYPIKPELQSDVRITEESLAKVAKLADLFALRLSADGRELIALGRARALEMAKGLIEIHLRKVPDMARTARLALQLQTKVKAEQSKITNGTFLTFQVDRDKIGRLMGTGGSNIRAAQQIPGVNRIDMNDGLVTIYADSREEALQAWELLEVVTERYGVKQDQVGFIIGKKGQQIQELERMSGCNINVPAGTSDVLIVGSRAGVAKARALLDYVVETLEEQRAKEQEIHALSGELRSMGLGPGPGFYSDGYFRRDGTSPHTLEFISISPISISPRFLL